MEPIETRLRSAPLAAPPAGLDRRVEAMFRTACREGTQVRRALFVGVLSALGAAGTAAALVLAVAPRPGPPPATLVYRFEPQGRLREMLLGSAADRSDLPHFVVGSGPP